MDLVGYGGNDARWRPEVVVLAEVGKRIGSLQWRIATGQVEPISDRERAQLQELREAYIRRFGEVPDAPQLDRTA